MESEKITQLRAGTDTAFIDSTGSSNLAYRPQFVYKTYTNI